MAFRGWRFSARLYGARIGLCLAMGARACLAQTEVLPDLGTRFITLARGEGAAGGSGNASSPQAAVQLAPPWHLDRIDQRRLPLDGVYVGQGEGEGVNIYVVAAGVNALHADLRTANGSASRVTAAYTLDAASPADVDLRGEGTLAAGVAAGLVHGAAKRARLHSVKVFRDGAADAATDEAAVLRGLQWVLENHERPALVLWLTFPRAAGVPSSGERRAMLRNLTAAGVPVVVPAGFARTDAGAAESLDACDVDVAGDAAALTVSSTDQSDTLAQGRLGGVGFKARSGPCVQLYAPGAQVVGPARSPSVTALVRASSPVLAPAVAAGAAAVYMAQHPNATAGQVMRALTTAATLGAVNVEGNASAPGGRGSLLFSRIMPAAGDALPATLYAVAMALGPRGPQQAGPVAHVGLCFDKLPLPTVSAADVAVTLLESGQLVAVRPANVTRLHAEGRSFLIAMRLPADYRGMVQVQSTHAAQPLRFLRVARTLAAATAHHF